MTAITYRASKLSAIIVLHLGVLLCSSCAAAANMTKTDHPIDEVCSNTTCSIHQKQEYVHVHSSEKEEGKVSSSGSIVSTSRSYHLRGLNQFCDLCPTYEPNATPKPNAHELIVDGIPGSISCQDGFRYVEEYYLPSDFPDSPRTTCDDKLRAIQSDFCGIPGLGGGRLEKLLDDNKNIPAELICSDSPKDRCGFDSYDKEWGCIWTYRACTWEFSSESCTHGLTSNEIIFFGLSDDDLNVCSMASSDVECWSTPVSDEHCGSFAGMERDSVCYDIADKQTCEQSSTVVSEPCEWYEKDYGRETMFPSCCDYEYNPPSAGTLWCEEAGDGSWTFVADGRTVTSAVNGLTCDDYFSTKYKHMFHSRDALLGSALYADIVPEMDAACCVPPTNQPTAPPSSSPTHGLVPGSSDPPTNRPTLAPSPLTDAPTGPPTCDALDVFGTEMVYVPDPGKGSSNWYSEWNEYREVQSPPTTIDPVDARVELRMQGTVLFSKGSAILTDNAQLFIRSREPASWESLEFTGFARYLQDGAISPGSGFNMIAPTNYKGPQDDDDCNSRYYQVQIRRDDGRVAIWKRGFKRAQTLKKHRVVESLSNSSLRTWVGMKIVVLAVGNDSVKLEVYVDPGSGWQQVFSFVDEPGSWATTSDIPSDCGFDRDDVVSGGKNFVGVGNFVSLGAKVEWKDVTIRNVLPTTFEEVCGDDTMDVADEVILTEQPSPLPMTNYANEESGSPTSSPFPGKVDASSSTTESQDGSSLLIIYDPTKQLSGESGQSEVRASEQPEESEQTTVENSEQTTVENSEQIEAEISSGGSCGMMCFLEANLTTLIGATAALLGVFLAGGGFLFWRRNRAKEDSEDGSIASGDYGVKETPTTPRNTNGGPADVAWLTF